MYNYTPQLIIILFSSSILMQCWLHSCSVLPKVSYCLVAIDVELVVIATVGDQSKGTAKRSSTRPIWNEDLQL